MASTSKEAKAVAREAEDHRERLFWPRPEFAYQRFAGCLDETAQDERDDDRVVQLPRDRDEVGHEIEGQGEVANEGEQEQLSVARDTWLTCQAGNENDAVRDEPGKGTCIVAPTANHQVADEPRVDHKGHAKRDQEPHPPLHGTRLRPEYDPGDSRRTNSASTFAAC